MGIASTKGSLQIMCTSQHAFAAEQYASRARDYVASAVHSSGGDLDQIETELRGRSTARVLDLGMRGGHVSYRAAPHVAEVVACDVTASMLDAVAATAAERGLSNIACARPRRKKLPFPDASFDVVLCRFTAHHWEDMEAGLREARRVLKPAAGAVFIDVVAPADRVLDTYLQAIELLRDASHVRNYSIAEWVSALSRSGSTYREHHCPQAADGVSGLDRPHPHLVGPCRRDPVFAGRGASHRAGAFRDRRGRQLRSRGGDHRHAGRVGDHRGEPRRRGSTGTPSIT